MVVRGSQVWRIRWMWNCKSIRASIIFHASTLQCEVWHCHAKNKFYPAFPWSFACNSVQLLTIEISSDGAASWKKFPMNNPSYSPPNAQHYLLWMKDHFRRCYTSLSSSQPLSLARVVNIHHPLLIASNKIAEPLVVAVRCH